MSISYKKLWKLMIDHDMNKTQLRMAAGLSTNVIAKLSKNDPVSMDTLMRICKAFHCDVGDIVEVIEDSDQLMIENYSLLSDSDLLMVAEKAYGSKGVH